MFYAAHEAEIDEVAGQILMGESAEDEWLFRLDRATPGEPPFAAP